MPTVREADDARLAQGPQQHGPVLDPAMVSRVVWILLRAKS
jgi:hypothetical protein